MNEKRTLFLLDELPLSPNWETYFLKFNINFISFSHLKLLFKSTIQPEAVFIDQTFLKKHPQVLKKLYQHFFVPLIIIADTLDDDCLITTLETYADDYFLKTTPPRELLAKINVLKSRLRIYQTNLKAKIRYQFCEWTLDTASHQLRNTARKELVISSDEYLLLLAFLTQPQQLLSRAYLLKKLKKNFMQSSDRSIDIKINRLRLKLEKNTKQPQLIKTVRNAGYIFTPHVSIEKE